MVIQQSKYVATAIALSAATLTVSTLTTAGPGHPASGAPVAARCTVAGVVATWSPTGLARQTIVVPVPETSVDDVSAEVANGAGGVILFGNSAPLDLGTKLRHLLSTAPQGIAPVVMTDEEGGAVQRMANLVGSMPSARQMAASMTPTQVHALAQRVGAKMRQADVTMNLAPVLDLDNRPGPSATNPDGTRSFSINPVTAQTYGLAFANGMRAAGVVPVVKHFPGLGGATANTDLSPAWTLPWSTLETHGLRPFVGAINAGEPAVMVTTARVPGLTSLPATLSSHVVGRELRRRLGFTGLVMTDSLSGGAVSGAGYSVQSAAVRALKVGADMVLFNAPPRQVATTTASIVQAVVTAVRDGDLPIARLRHAAVHVLTAKRAPVC